MDLQTGGEVSWAIGLGSQPPIVPCQDPTRLRYFHIHFFSVEAGMWNSLCKFLDVMIWLEKQILWKRSPTYL